jgi:TrmH family RNA methyltransferase
MLSRAHPIARRVRALRGDAALRAASGVLVAEGVHLSQEALAAGARIEAAIASPRLRTTDEGRELERRLSERGIPVHACSDDVLAGLQDARSHQPVLLIVEWAAPELSAVVRGSGPTPLLVVACGVQDPGNLGALLRTALASGATGFVSASGGAGLTHPRTVRASMGSIFRLPAVEAPLEDVLDEISRGGIRALGADARGGVDGEDADWSGPVALLLGGEGAGLPAEARSRLASSVFVPMAPGVESLSVAAAAAVLLFTAARKRRLVSSAG